MARLLLYESGCPGCKEYLKVIPKLNLRLPIDKKIILKNCFEWEQFGFKSHPIMDSFSRDNFKDYPLLYLDEILIVGVLWSEQLKKFLISYLKEEFLY